LKLNRAILIAFAMLVGQFSASAADLAHMRNGSSISFIRKEQIGNVTRLYITGGHLDVPTSEIESFDKDDTPEPPATSQPEVEAQSAQTTAAVKASTPVAATNAVTQADIDQVVREASLRHQIDPDFVASVIKAESNFKPHAVSKKGAQGLMQLMPQTATQLGVKDAFDPKANVEAGTAHLSALLDQYNNDPIKALAAYNAGAHRVQQYHGVPPYQETRAYVAKIVRDFNNKKRAQMRAAKAQSKAPTAAAKDPATNAKAPARKPATAQPQRSAIVNKITKPA
jgi:transglycosylase-like protein with SLT domain